MKLNNMWVGLAALAVGLPAAAAAQTPSGWYAAASGTLWLHDDTGATIANAPAPGSTVRTHNPFEPGFGGQLALGYGFGQFRFEGELGYARATQATNTALVPATGIIFSHVEEETLRGMLNGYVDFDAGVLKPYLGIGLGYAQTDLKFIAPRAPFPTEQPRLLIDDDDGGFAWQAMAGAAVPLNDSVSMTIQYRWFDGGDWNGADNRNEAVVRSVKGQNVDVGLRLRF